MLITHTKENMECSVEFVVKTTGLSLADVHKYLDLLPYNVDTIMFPWYRVMEAVKSMRVQVWEKKGLSFPLIVTLTEKIFLENYVNLNLESSSLLLDIYHGRKEIWKYEHDKDCRENITS